MIYIDLLVLLIGLLAIKARDSKLRLLLIHIIIGILIVVSSTYTASLGNNIYFNYITGPYEVIIHAAILFPLAQ